MHEIGTPLQQRHTNDSHHDAQHSPGDGRGQLGRGVKKLLGAPATTRMSNGANSKDRSPNAAARKASKAPLVLQEKSVVLENGDKFIGRMVENVPLSGTMIHANGSMYTGTFLNGDRHGRGSFKCANQHRSGSSFTTHEMHFP